MTYYPCLPDSFRESAPFEVHGWKSGERVGSDVQNTQEQPAEAGQDYLLPGHR
jgi:hypothetical protein